MTDLTSWLLARLAEDEAVARAAIERSGAQWHVKVGEYDDAAVVGTSDEYHDQYRSEEGVLWDWEGGFICAYAVSVEHIARHDPARVLAEVAAKRAIVELCAAEIDNGTDGAATASSVLYWLAQPYADRPDFDPAWHIDA